MSDVTFGVKVTEELKEQISKLMSHSGLTGKEFMQQIINSYTLEKTKESIPQIAEDLKELQTLTQRINSIYLNLGYRIENITKSQQEQIQKELQGKDSIILDLQDKIEALKTENNALNNTYDDMVNSYNDLNDRVNGLTDGNNNIKALNEEYKSKIDTMAGIVEEYKQYKVEVEDLKRLIADLQSKNTDLNNSIKDKDLSMEKLNSEVVAVKQDKENIVNELNTRHTTELEAVREKAELLKDKAILELQKQYQQQIQELQQKHNSDIEQYQAKYKELLDQLEKIKTSTNKSTSRSVKAQTKEK